MIVECNYMKLKSKCVYKMNNMKNRNYKKVYYKYAFKYIE